MQQKRWRRGSAPDPAGGAHDAPQDRLVAKLGALRAPLGELTTLPQTL